MQINKKKLKYKISYYYNFCWGVYSLQYNGKQRKTNVVCKIDKTAKRTFYWKHL